MSDQGQSPVVLDTPPFSLAGWSAVLQEQKQISSARGTDLPGGPGREAGEAGWGH